MLTRLRMQKEAMMRAQSAFAGGEDPQMQWALAESQVTHEPLEWRGWMCDVLTTAAGQG